MLDTWHQYFKITEGEFCFCNYSLMVSDQPSNQGKLKSIDKIQNGKKKTENCSKALTNRLGVFKTVTFQRKDWFLSEKSLAFLLRVYVHTWGLGGMPNSSANNVTWWGTWTILYQFDLWSCWTLSNQGQPLGQ